MRASLVVFFNIATPTSKLWWYPSLHRAVAGLFPFLALAGRHRLACAAVEAAVLLSVRNVHRPELIAWLVDAAFSTPEGVDLVLTFIARSSLTGSYRLARSAR